MTTKQTPTTPQGEVKIRFDCLGKIVTVLPSPSFWPLAKGTIFELQKYQTENKTPRKPIFVSLDAKTFRLYLVPIFDLGYTNLSGGNITMLNVRRAVKKWVTKSILWEALINSRSITFLGNVLQSSREETLELNEYLRAYSNNSQGLKLANMVLFDRIYCSFRVEVEIVGEHNFKTSHMHYYCNRCGQEHANRSDFKECTEKEMVILSHDEARNIKFHSLNVELTPEIKQLTLKTFLETHPENEKIYHLVYK